MKILSVLLLLSFIETSAPVMAMPDSLKHSALFQISEVSHHQVIATEKGAAKCGAGACGSTKKSKPDAKSTQTSTGKVQDKATKSDMKCGAGACGSKGKPQRK